MFDPESIQSIAPPSRGPSPLALLLQIWSRPARTLRAVAEGSGRLWLLPFVLALALTTARVLISGPLAAEASRARTQAMREAQQAQIPAEFWEPMAEAEVPAPPKVLTLGLPLLGGLAGVLVGWLVRAGVLQVGSMALGGRQSFGTVYRVSLWASFPLILREAVQAVYMALSHQAINGPGLSGLVSQPAAMEGNAGMVSGALGMTPISVAGILLSRVDLYAIWYLVLLVVGVAVACRLSRGRAVAVVSLYTVLSLLTGLTRLVTQGLLGVF